MKEKWQEHEIKKFANFDNKNPTGLTPEEWMRYKKFLAYYISLTLPTGNGWQFNRPVRNLVLPEPMYNRFNPDALKIRTVIGPIIKYLVLVGGFIVAPFMMGIYNNDASLFFVSFFSFVIAIDFFRWAYIEREIERLLWKGNYADEMYEKPPMNFFNDIKMKKKEKNNE